MTLPRLLTLDEAAAVLRKTKDWTQREAAAGHIPSRKIGGSRMFTEDDIVAFLESSRKAAPDVVVAASARRRRSA